MHAEQAMQLTLRAFPKDALFVCANGYVSREAFNTGDSPRCFFMLGSMGLTSSIGLGVALARPDRPVVVIDGDGNVLMGLGALALVGAQRPRNLFHVCIDNGVYASTGNQPTVAPQVSLEGIAREAGYAWAEKTATADGAASKLAELAGREGPGFLRIVVEPQEHPRSFERVSYTCEQIRERFEGALRADS